MDSEALGISMNSGTGYQPVVTPLVSAPTTARTTQSSGLESLPQGLIHTTISPLIARAMTLLFLCAIFAVPILQLAYELFRGRPLHELDILKPPARVALDIYHGDLRQAYRETKWWLSRQHLSAYEDKLRESSSFKHLVQPRIQNLLTGYLAFGNSIAIVARDGQAPNGWLYYQLAVDYIAGPGFLQPHILHLRKQHIRDEGETNPSPDPRPAIIQFHRDCQRLGVHLVFVPIPVKPMLQPAELDPRLAITTPTSPPNNPDYARFLNDLRAAGIDVFDPTPTLLLPDESPRFLWQDTHWTPQWMQQVAHDLSEHLRHRVNLPPTQRRFIIEESRISRIGDIVDTLHLPPTQTLFPPQLITIHRILDPDTRQSLASNPAADVLVIGDSFSNIYSAPQMGWGDSAGFPHQIARFLNRDVEILVKNGCAATDLRAELASRPNPLQSKRLIIWQVAMHELSSSNWRIVPIP